jgi:hypothetical protein
MGETDVTLSHHVAQISIAKLVGNVPPHSENDDWGIEMTVFEQGGMTQE